MPAPPAQSSLRVDVVFSDPVYFAGEDLVCRITFRNLAPGPQLHHSSASDLQRTTSASRLRKSSRASSVSDADRPPTSPASTPPPPQPSLSAAPLTPRTPSSSSFGPPLAPSSPSSSFSSSTTTSPSVLQTASQNGSFPSPSPVHASPHGMLHSRRSSMRVPKTRGGETLMMGYAQLSGQFTIDESLVETSVFNEAKKLGIVGGKMGGGVVGLGAEKSDSGIWGQLGFGITNGLSSLLNGNEVSSIAEMKSTASSNVISIISTPQSLLFVDLRLSPGESKSYSYRFTLPKTLPPSYRGKALKISYNLTIGTQRVGKGFQAPKTTKFPFRVFQNIDAGGHQPVHSLTSPIVILRDEAKTEIIDDGPELNRASSVSSLSGLTSNSESKRLARDNPQSENKETLEDFMAYVDGLLSYKSSNAVAIHHIRPPSPSSPPEFPLSSSVTSARSSCRESVDLAIQRNSISADGIVLNNMYEIARNKQKIASLVLSKPVYKLGETVVMILDFAGAVLPCYHVVASLETTEIIDASIAQRSSQFNERATRKVYVQSSFSTISSQRASFSFCIPTTATPQFDTSYISSRWSIRIEFVTSPIEMPANLLPAIDLDEEADRSSAPQSESQSRSGSQGTIDIPEPAQTPPSAQTFRNGQPHTPSTPIHERTSSLNATASPAPGNGTRARADSQQLQAVLQVSRTLAKTTLSEDELSVTDDEDVEDDDEHDDEKADVFHGLSVARAQRRPSATNTPPSYAATKSHRPEVLRVTHKDERGVMYSLVDELLSETFECRIPIKVFPTNQDIAAMSFHIQPSGGYAV